MLLNLNSEYMPPITTERLVLRKLCAADAQDIYEYSKDPDVARYVLWYPHRSIADTRFFLRCLMRQYRAGEEAPYGITLRESGKAIGTIGFANVNREHRCAEIGYSLHKAYWNRGYMSEALEAMIRCGFEEHRFYRIEAMHDVRNEASGRVMLKCGMRCEGRLYGRFYSKGEHIDVMLYAITLPQYRHRN